MNDLGSFLRCARKAKCVSMNEVYRHTGITNSRISKLENNSYKEPSPVVLKKLADYYEVSVVDLFIRAGYLTYDSLNICPQIFHGVEKLTDDDRNHIQGQIDYIVSKQYGKEKQL